MVDVLSAAAVAWVCLSAVPAPAAINCLVFLLQLVSEPNAAPDAIPASVMSRLHVLQVTATEAPTAQPTTQTPEGVTDIYIGKGRYVKDDPKKYPAKDDLGPFMGATGAIATTHALTHSHQTGGCSTSLIT
jgi:hypothetical protein